MACISRGLSNDDWRQILSAFRLPARIIDESYPSRRCSRSARSVESNNRATTALFGLGAAVMLDEPGRVGGDVVMKVFDPIAASWPASPRWPPPGSPARPTATARERREGYRETGITSTP